MSKGAGKGKFDKKFQVNLGGDWKDYDQLEDTVLKRAYLVGQPNAKFTIRGQTYAYDFIKMVQRNVGSGKERKVRAPPHMEAPKDPLLPPGPMVVIPVPPGGGKSTTIQDPNNPGQQITVAIPPMAKPGSQIAVPIPGPGEDVSTVVEKQKGWRTGAKVAAGAAAVGALAVGGVVLGEHFSGGAVSGWLDEAGADWAAGAVGDAGEWAGGAIDTAGDVAGDAGDWAGGAAEDVGDWLGDAAEDVGDFITDLF